MTEEQTGSAYSPVTAKAQRLTNACFGLERITQFLVKCATADEPDSRDSLDRTVSMIVACLDELELARAAFDSDPIDSPSTGRAHDGGGQ